MLFVHNNEFTNPYVWVNGKCGIEWSEEKAP